jgi:hypothetical protein
MLSTFWENNDRLGEHGPYPKWLTTRYAFNIAISDMVLV